MTLTSTSRYVAFLFLRVDTVGSCMQTNKCLLLLMIGIVFRSSLFSCVTAANTVQYRYSQANLDRDAGQVTETHR